MSNPAPSQLLAQFVATWNSDDVPPATIENAKLALLNYLATAIAGCSDPAIVRSLSVLGRYSGPATAGIVGRAERMDAPTAAFLGAASANVYDFDDTHIPTIIHPTAPVAAALLALCEQQEVSGRDFLAALAIGIEIECRIGNVISPHHYRHGWHITATCGVLGAAMACGRILGLTIEEQVWALGIAAGQSAGLVALLGTDAKSIAVGNAARNGLLAAIMAQSGISGPPLPLEGRLGFLSVYGDNPDLGALTAGLGRSWELSNNAYKPYPCGVVLNPVIDACLVLRTAPLVTEDIVSVLVEGNQLLVDRTDRAVVSTGRLAQVSAQHAAAITLLHGLPGLAAFSDQAVAQPETTEMRRRVTVRCDPGLPGGAARVTLVMADARHLIETITTARGSREAPLTAPDLEAKFHALTAARLPLEQRRQLVDALWSLENSADVASLFRLATPKPPENEAQNG